MILGDTRIDDEKLFVTTQESTFQESFPHLHSCNEKVSFVIWVIMIGVAGLRPACLLSKCLGKNLGSGFI